MTKRRNLLFMAAAVALLAFATLPLSAQSGGNDMMAPAERNVTYQGPGGTTLRGYLATPRGSGPFPAVVLIHEWWGLNRDTTELARALAQEGYVVLAADAFRGSVAGTADEARRQVTETPGEQIAGDLDAAFDYLGNHRSVDSERIAVAGFCFGGTQAMRMGTRNPDLAAVVIFYGSGPITDPQQLGEMQAAGPVLGIYGGDDQGIPIDQVLAFQDALDERDVDNVVTVYLGVGHAFVKNDSYQNEGPAGMAWKQMVTFLNQRLAGKD